MAEHTPGPWKPDQSYMDEDGQRIGWIVFSDQGDYPVLPANEADAHLIAAAPDLLAAADRVHYSNGGSVDNKVIEAELHTPAGYSAISDACDLCAAIAKAKP